MHCWRAPTRLIPNHSRSRAALGDWLGAYPHHCGSCSLLPGTVDQVREVTEGLQRLDYYLTNITNEQVGCRDWHLVCTPLCSVLMIPPMRQHCCCPHRSVACDTVAPGGCTTPLRACNVKQAHLPARLSQRYLYARTMRHLRTAESTHARTMGYMLLICGTIVAASFVQARAGTGVPLSIWVRAGCLRKCVNMASRTLSQCSTSSNLFPAGARCAHDVQSRPAAWPDHLSLTCAQCLGHSPCLVFCTLHYPALLSPALVHCSVVTDTQAASLRG